MNFDTRAQVLFNQNVGFERLEQIRNNLRDANATLAAGESAMLDAINLAIEAAAIASENVGDTVDGDVRLAFSKRAIGNDLTPAGATSGHAFYAHLYMAQIMFLSSEDNWDWYFPAIRDQLIESQQEDGSWMGDYIGQTYGTAIALNILQLPYKMLPIMQR